MRSKFKWIFTLLLAFSMQFSFAQEKTVTGTVTDGKLPLSGANVKSSRGGVSTDADGKFAIKASAGDKLTVTYKGFEPQTITVGAANSYNVKMKEAVEVLKDVLVKGAMGISKKKDAQTSTSQVVGSKELTQAQAPSVVQSLAGKVSGLQINTTTSGVQASTRIVLRGLRTITGNPEALVVIDGSVSNATILSQLPPEIVESVNVIKGQQGAALYGELGSNGVIIVNTKRGSKLNKLRVSLNSAIDFESISFLPERQTTYGQGWATDSFDLGSGPITGYVPFENGGWGPAYSDPSMPSMVPVGLPQADGSFIMTPWAPIKDNIKDFFKTGTLLQNGISLNMGDEDGYVLFSYNRQNTNYVVDKDALSRNSFLFKGGKKFGKFGLDGTVNYISQSVSETEGDLYSDLLQTATNIPVGQFSNPSNEHHWTVYYRSPYWKREALRYDRRSTIFNTTLAANYKFNKNISVNYQVNANFRGSKNEYHNDGFANSLYSYDITSLGYNYGGSTQFTYEDLGGHGVTSSYYVQKTDRRDLNSDLMFNFDYALTDKLNLKLNVGNNLQENYFTQATNGGTGIDKAGIYNVNNLLQLNNVLNAGDESDTPGEFYGTGNKLNNRWTKVRRAALFANADFGYNDYLFLNATARYEKSSVIKKSQFYPSIGLSFIPTKAIEALKDGKVLNHMKIYGSWVRTGNSSVISAYQTDEAPGVFGTGYPFGNLNSYLQQQNQTFNNVNPEYVTTKEIGVNLGFFNNRLGIDAALYQSDTDDLISRSTVSSTSGLATLLTNVGSLTNKGFELDLNVVPVDYKGFRWEFKGSYTTFNTKITSLADGASSLNLQQPYTFVGIFADVNEDFPLIKGTTYMRDPQGNVIVDANGSPIRGSEFKKLGKATPDYILGLTNSFEYKGLKLTAVIDYRTGHQIYSDTKRWLSWSGHLVDSAEFDRNVGFVYPNSVQETSPGVYTQNTTLVNGGGYAGTLNYYSGNYDRTGENFVLDATALKVRELTLSYALPTRWLANTGIQSFRFGVNARNPFVILSDENKGYSDPETSNTNGTATGFSPIGNYPPTRTFGFSMNVNF